MSIQINNTQIQEADAAAGMTGTGKWRLERLFMTRGWDINGANIVANPSKSLIEIGLVGDYGRRRGYGYSGLVADNLILALNKANLSAGQPLEYKVLQQLIQDAKESGSLTGTAD